MAQNEMKAKPALLERVRSMEGLGGCWTKAQKDDTMNTEQIARVAYEVNRAYCQALGDNSQPKWEDAPQWQRDSAMLGVQLHTENPNAGPQASHESWMAQMVAYGWVYGPEKRPEAKEHHCIVAFDQLTREQQAKDYIFRGVVHALAHAPSVLENDRDAISLVAHRCCREFGGDCVEIESGV